MSVLHGYMSSKNLVGKAPKKGETLLYNFSGTYSKLHSHRIGILDFINLCHFSISIQLCLTKRLTGAIVISPSQQCCV